MNKEKDVEGFYTGKGVFHLKTDLESIRTGGTKGVSPSIQIGMRFVSNIGGEYEVVDYYNASNVLVKFLKSGTFVLTAAKEVRNGSIRDPYHPSVCGIGFMGQGRFRAKDKASTGHTYFTDTYSQWSGMMQRVYSANSMEKRITYTLSDVTPEWWNYQNAAEWMIRQKGFGTIESNGKCYPLDKDLLVPNNSTYGPDTCCFLPNAINVALKGRQINSDKEYPCGVYWHKASNGFISCIDIYGKQEHLGCFDTVDDAYRAYKNSKEGYLKDLAKKYIDTISERAYDALMDFNLCERSVYHEKRNIVQ